jgi:serine phosphatase RsbU (regulator of sigma subunit)
LLEVKNLPSQIGAILRRTTRLSAALCLFAINGLAQSQTLAKLTTDDRPGLLKDLAGIAIGGFLFALGLVAAALFTWQKEKRNRSLLYFGIFCVLYGFRLIGNAGLMQLSVALPPVFWLYQDAFITYLIPLPALLSVELLLGRGWRSSLRTMWQLQLVYAISAVVIDSIWGPHTALGPNGYFVIAGMLIITANVLQAVRHKEIQLGWELRPILGGLLSLVLLAVNENLVKQGLVPWRFSFEPLGVLVFVFCLGYVLVQRFFKNEQELLAITYELRESALRTAAAEAQARATEVDRQRQAQELEEARQLQLSMLPKKLPKLPHLDIAAYMKTATEVGGDYYDFHLSEDGTLTVAIGDATGHGLKAGTMVTATKSLFETLAAEAKLSDILQRKSRALKRMNLRGMFMALTLIRLNGLQLQASIAGMPPVLIYRAASGAVEEIAIQALPLGSLTNYQYPQQELTLALGDVVVLLSDGLPERFNPQGEMLDYATVKRTVAEAAPQAPQQVIDALVKIGEDWALGRIQEDDITFVVLKVRENH